MKSLQHLWQALACLFLLGACATMPQRNTYVTLDGDVVEPSKHGEERPTTTFTTFNESSVAEVWVVALADNNPLIKKTLWEIGNRTRYQIMLPKQEMVTFMLCWFDEHGNKVSKEWQKVTRQTLSSRPLELHITDAMLYGKEPQVGIWVNMKTESVLCWDNAGNRAVLMPGEGFRVIKNTGDHVKVYCQEIGKQRVQIYGGGILRAKDQRHYEFNGHLYDWNVEID